MFSTPHDLLGTELDGSDSCLTEASAGCEDANTSNDNTWMNPTITQARRQVLE